MAASVIVDHPPVPAGPFSSAEDYIGHLMHLRAYELAAALGAGRSVLDWGCENGFGAALVSRTASRVAGLDINEASIRAARARYPEIASNFWLYDGRALSFAERNWDVVACFKVIEQVRELDDFLGLIGEAMNSTGLALFTTPNREIRLDPGAAPWNRTHVTEFSAAQLEAVLRKHFRHVALFGLQGEPEINRIEQDRCHRARLAARKRGSLSHRVFGLAKAAPKRMLRTMRSNAGAGPASISESVLARYSTSQLVYSKDGLSSALDLLAVCSNTDLDLAWIGAKLSAPSMRTEN